jgi:hypothetical protein
MDWSEVARFGESQDGTGRRDQIEKSQKVAALQIAINSFSVTILHSVFLGSQERI